MGCETANGNLHSSSLVGQDSERRLCWTEDSRLQGYVEYSAEEGNIAAYYNYAGLYPIKKLSKVNRAATHKASLQHYKAPLELRKLQAFCATYCSIDVNSER